jgi:hypothetical protein
MLSLIRGVDGIRHLFEASNSQNNNEQAQQTAQISSKMVEVCLSLKLVKHDCGSRTFNRIHTVC